ncbi:MAG: tyrosine-protein phosphatase [Kiritimatiellae bacterium]|nr:tyrosine-protein phosphatase [Kiritimatiellia bacterium]
MNIRIMVAIAAGAMLGAWANAAEIKTVEPAEGAVVPLLTDAQKAYIAMPTAERREKFASQSFRSKVMGLPAEKVPGEEKKREAYWPKTVRLAWEGAGDAECQVRVKDAKKGVVVIDQTVKGNELYIDNLEIAAEYEWGVKCGDETARGKFKTEDIAPRLIRYPGVPNVRDFGGRIGLGGKRVRQGLVFRSAGLNYNAKEIYYTIAELRELGKEKELKAAADEAQKRLDQLLAWQADPKTMDLNDKEYLDWAKRHEGEPPAKFLSSRVKRAQATVKAGGEPKVVKGREPGKSRVEGERGEYIRGRFGIKTDIDLRSDRECFGMTGSPLGPTVKWEHISSSAYGGMSSDSAKKAFAKVFRVFLDEKNYPIDFHCIAGQDRTGAVAYILNGLLGVDEDQLALDWEVTGFWNRGAEFCHSKRYDKLVECFQKHYPAPTVRERLEKYVLDIGFTEADIEKFRGIMLEK